MSEVEIAWVAGLLEGEGSFQLSNKRPTSRRTTTVRCSMTDLDIIKRLADTVNGGTVNPEGYSNGRSAQPAGTQYKRIYSWQMSRARDVYALLVLIKPHMGWRRTQQIQILLDYFEKNPVRYYDLGGDIPHGTRSGYEYHKCRCEKCKEVNNVRWRRFYNKRKEAVASALG